MNSVSGTKIPLSNTSSGPPLDSITLVMVWVLVSLLYHVTVPPAAMCILFVVKQALSCSQPRICEPSCIDMMATMGGAVKVYVIIAWETRISKISCRRLAVSALFSFLYILFSDSVVIVDS